MHTKETYFYLMDILHKLILTNSYVSKYPNKKNIKMEYIRTKEQIANIFSKPLPRETFEYLQRLLGVISSPK